MKWMPPSFIPSCARQSQTVMNVARVEIPICGLHLNIHSNLSLAKESNHTDVSPGLHPRPSPQRTQSIIPLVWIEAGSPPNRFLQLFCRGLDFPGRGSAEPSRRFRWGPLSPFVQVSPFSQGQPARPLLNSVKDGGYVGCLGVRYVFSCGLVNLRLFLFQNIHTVFPIIWVNYRRGGAAKN